jgi:hypothetical protein
LFNIQAQQALMPLKADYAKYQGQQQHLYGSGGGSEAEQARVENLLFDKDTRERIVHVPGPHGHHHHDDAIIVVLCGT